MSMLLAACSEADSPSAPVNTSPDGTRAPTLASVDYQTLAASQRGLAQSGRTARGIEDEILRLESESPGFGGMYYDADAGSVVMYVRDTSTAPAMLTAIRNVKGRADRTYKSILDRDLPIRIRQAQFPFSMLVSYQIRLKPHILLDDEVYTLDADEALNRVRIEVASAGAVTRAKALLRSMDIPESAVVFAHTSPRTSVAIAGLRGTWRPTYAGTEMSLNPGPFPNNSSPEDYLGSCTLGFNVTSGTGARYALTASHCINSYANNPSGPLGLVTGQPWAQTTGGLNLRIGTTSVVPNWVTPGCPVTYCVWADAALIGYDASISSYKRVMKTQFVGTLGDGGSITYAGYWNVAGTYVPSYGEQVDKMGRTSGWTRGTFLAGCVSHNNLVIMGGANQTLQIGCDDEIGYARALPGDSGGSVFVLLNGSLYAVGVLTASTRFVNQYGQQFYCYKNPNITPLCRWWSSPISAAAAQLGTAINPS